MTVITTGKRIDLYPAKTEDIDIIMNLENANENKNFVWQGSYEEHMSEIDDPSYILAVFREKSDNRIVGYVLAGVEKRSDVFELRRIVVAEKGRGYGREAMSLLMDYGFNILHINRFWLDVYPDNFVGINLYKSLGMKHEGTLRQSYRSERGYLDQMIFSILKEEYFLKNTG